MSLWLSLFAIIALLAMSFFFSGSETALTAASRARMYQLAKSGSKRASLVVDGVYPTRSLDTVNGDEVEPETGLFGIDGKVAFLSRRLR